MLVLTEKAAKKVLEIREAENISPDQHLRVCIRGGGCSGFSFDLFFDTAKDLDNRSNCLGVDILVDPMSMMYLLGTEIDYIEDLMKAGFKFNNPNVKSTCGCGSSVQF